MVVMRYLTLYAIDYSIRNEDICSNNCNFAHPLRLFNTLYFLLTSIDFKSKTKIWHTDFYNNFELLLAHPDSIFQRLHFPLVSDK